MVHDAAAQPKTYLNPPGTHTQIVGVRLHILNTNSRVLGVLFVLTAMSNFKCVTGPPAAIVD